MLTYEFTFSKGGQKSMGCNFWRIHNTLKKIWEKHSRNIDITNNQNSDGKYSDNEFVVSSEREGY